MRAALSLEMTAILRMKRNKLQYRVNTGRETRLLDANELYPFAVRKQWNKVRGMHWKAVKMIVEEDLVAEKGKDKPSGYRKIKLLFARGVYEEEGVKASRKDWALFLSTGPQIGTSTMLQAYALR